MKNLLTDIAGVRVGHADDAALGSGVTAVEVKRISGCLFASSTSSVSVACAGGRVGVLFSNNLSAASQVQLYLCELPPLN